MLRRCVRLADSVPIRAQTTQLRWLSEEAAEKISKEAKEKMRQLRRSEARANAVSTTVYKVAKTSFDFSVVTAGMVIAGAIGFVLFQSLFSRSSPYRVYDKSLALVQEDPNVALILGKPVRGFDETRSRGGALPHEEGVDEQGRKWVGVSYNVQGPRGKATVTALMIENEAKELDFQYVMVQAPKYRPIFVVDNRDLWEPATS
jgi:hypothetical protein